MKTFFFYFRVVSFSALTVLASACSDSGPLTITPGDTTEQNLPADDQPIPVDGDVDTGDVDTEVNRDTADVSGTEPNTDSVRIVSIDDPDFLGNPALITEVVLVTGQSNALGLDTSFDEARDVSHQRAYAFTEHGWRIADLSQIWDLGWHPRNNPETDPSNNFGFHFVRTVAQRRPDRVIGMILVTLPGAGIGEWEYESALYMEIRNRVSAALNELPSKATIDGILWHQGETDWFETENYQTSLNQLIQNFRGESWFGEGKPFICGETLEAPLNKLLMALNNDGDPWTGCVVGNDLPTVRDDHHFSAEGLRIIGKRYANKYIQMTEQR